MKASDYIVSFLIEKGISDVFGYPGGMVTHLMDSFYKFRGKINAHVNYHEQASAFCACGFAQVSKKPGVAYATSGPGATNLITGIANAYFDSIPCVFFTGQVNSYESKCDLKVRQKGFQETDIVTIVKPITKYAKLINDPNELKNELEKAFAIAIDGRPGPVLLDIAMDVQRAEIDLDKSEEIQISAMEKKDISVEIDEMISALLSSKKPLILAGAGINQSNMKNEFLLFAEMTGIPIITSMIAIDLMSSNNPRNFGFIGAYGHRHANFCLANCDLIITFGSRIDCRQTGSDTGVFAKNAKIIRIDVDKDELTNKIKTNERVIVASLQEVLPKLVMDNRFQFGNRFSGWLEKCSKIKIELEHIDQRIPNDYIQKISELIPERAIITTDVGQNQVWVAQSFVVKEFQRILFSGGHGAMGYSLPAAIGAHYAVDAPVYCFSGDGGIQMNIQELQFIFREKIPVKIILLNNESLGMIRHFQEMYFDSTYMQTRRELGYTVPNFKKIAKAYGIRYRTVSGTSDIKSIKDELIDDEPIFIEVKLSDQTYVFPKLSMGRELYDQEPLLDRDKINEYLDDTDNFENKKRAIVTGASGFLGKEIVRQLQVRNYEVICPKRSNDTNEYLLSDYTKLKGVEAFFHLGWAGTRGEDRNLEDMQKQNIEMSNKMMNFAKQIGCKKFFGFGSQDEYGKMSGKVSEAYDTKPSSAYGKAKVNSYFNGLEIFKGSKVKFYWMRIFSLYGRGDYESSLISSCLKDFKNNKDIVLLRPNSSWDYLNVEDAANAIIKLCENENAEVGVYNLASGEKKTLLEYISTMKQVLISSSIIECNEKEENVDRFSLDINKLFKNTNWTKKISFEEGILKLKLKENL